MPPSADRAESGGAGSAAGQEALEFTGERFTPECVREIWYEHMHRYALAARLCEGRRVLDAACGEGYGSALLAGRAASVTGLDLSEEAIAHARHRYADLPGLEFQVGDCASLPFEDDSFERIVSFETLEHLEAQDAMLAEFRRVLAPGGCLLISSPDRAVYTDQLGNDNEFHVRELYRDELEQLLARHFRHHRLLGQKLLFQSAIFALDGQHTVLSQQWGGEALTDRSGIAHDPVYFLALCADREEDLPELPADLCLFDDAVESVYAHYHGEIRRNMAAGGIIADRDREIEELRRHLNEARAGSGDRGESAPDEPRVTRAPWYRRLLGLE